MAIDSEIVRSYAPGAGATVFEEIPNQQLNEALESGTVSSILMSPDYTMTLNKHVATKADLSGYAAYTDIQNIVDLSSLDFTWYDNPLKTLKIKANENGNTTQTPPLHGQIADFGEIAVDNADGSIWTRRYFELDPDDNPTIPIPNGPLQISRINAGSVNGIVIDKNNFVDGDVMKQYTVDKINEAFSYNSTTNSLTIKRVAV